MATKGRCVIIGSGLGGLSCGVILSQNGYDVTVLEQGNVAGGCLQCFSRGGVRFETGMHFIGSASPGELLYKLMRYLKLDDVRLRSLDRSGYDIVSLGGERFRFANGRDAFIDTMSGYFPRERSGLSRYYDIIEEIAGASSLHSFRQAETGEMVNMHYQTVSIDSVLDELFEDEMLKRVLVGNLPLYAAEKGKTPFSQHAFIMDFYNRSSYRIVGGSDRIAQSMVDTIRRNGGEVFTGRRVTHILTDESRATGVETEDGEVISADVVISAIHPSRTVELVDSHLLRPVYRRRMMNLRNTPGGFSVYLKFKPGTMPYMNSNFYGYQGDTPWNCEHYDGADWPKGYLYMHFCSEESPRYARSGVILTYMRYDEVARWNGTKVGKRGEDYEQFKRHRAELLIDAVCRDIPGLRDSIESYYTSTPLTYQDYTGTTGGSMYGVAKDITLGSESRVPHRTRIPNLLLTGQNINSHGMLGVLVGSIVTCSELLTSEHIYQQILEANQ